MRQKKTKWTEEKALKIVDGLLEWVAPNAVNGVDQNKKTIIDYLISIQMSIQDIKRLRKKYPAFNERYNQAFEIHRKRLGAEAKTYSNKTVTTYYKNNKITKVITKPKQ